MRVHLGLGLILAIAISVPSFAEDQYTTIWPGNAAIGGYIALPTGVEINGVTISIAPGSGQDGYSLVYSASSGLIGLVSVAGGAGGAFWSSETGYIYRDSPIVIGATASRIGSSSAEVLGLTRFGRPDGTQIMDIGLANMIYTYAALNTSGALNLAPVHMHPGFYGGANTLYASAAEYDNLFMTTDAENGQYAVVITPVTNTPSDNQFLTWNDDWKRGEWQSVGGLITSTFGSDYLVMYDWTTEKLVGIPIYYNDTSRRLSVNSVIGTWGALSVFDEDWVAAGLSQDYGNLVVLATTEAPGAGGKIGLGFANTSPSYALGGALQALRDDASGVLSSLGLYSRTGTGLDLGLYLDSNSNTQMIGYASSAQGFISDGSATLGSATIGTVTSDVANASGVVLSTAWDSQIEAICNSGAMTATPSWVAPGAMVYDPVNHPTQVFFHVGDAIRGASDGCTGTEWAYIDLTAVPQGGF